MAKFKEPPTCERCREEFELSARARQQIAELPEPNRDMDEKLILLCPECHEVIQALRKEPDHLRQTRMADAIKKIKLS